MSDSIQIDGPCVICLELVERKAAVWQCGTCFIVCHLSCIQQHARVRLTTGALLASALLAASATWNCPHCRSEFDASAYPSEYRCFCGTELRPADDPWLTPHTCGRPCRKLVTCPIHSCSSPCHSGPCQPCVITISQPCFCGKVQHVVRCGRKVTTCGEVCGRRGSARIDVSDDGTSVTCDHPCPQPCHVGKCSPCEILIKGASCECGTYSRDVRCADRDWNCGDVCGLALECGHHHCEVICHRPGACPPCPNSGERRCHCGKSSVGALACDIPTPSCGGTCNKPAPCGRPEHLCSQRCHPGVCSHCNIVIDAPCRCGRVSKRRVCSAPELICTHKCEVLRDCERHMCRRRCCPGLGAAPAGTGSSELSEIAAISYCQPCTETCGRKLPCGKHSCKAFCHSGDCEPCPLTERVCCSCGGTSVAVPCGRSGSTKLITCKLPCKKPSLCQHMAANRHSCHEGPCQPCPLPCGKPYDRCGHFCEQPCVRHADSGCPPCTLGVSRWCVGLHTQQKLPCSAPALFRCAIACPGRLACEKHPCARGCHMPPSSRSNDDLNKLPPCGLCELSCPESLSCGHRCATAGSKCHPGPCKACEVVVDVPCGCGRQSFQVPCSSKGSASLSCGQPCAKMRTICGHACGATCHPAECDAASSCTRPVTRRCACGAMHLKMACGGDPPGFRLPCPASCMTMARASVSGDASAAVPLITPVVAAENVQPVAFMGPEVPTLASASARKRITGSKALASAPRFVAVTTSKQSAWTRRLPLLLPTVCFVVLLLLAIWWLRS